MKKFFALLLTLAMVLSLAACGGKEEKPADKPAEAPSSGESAEAPAADPIVLRVSHKSSENSSWQKGAEKWDELLNERTNGAIRLEIHPNSALGDQKESTEACQLGVIDIVLNAPATLAGFMTEISALDLPFLFDSYEHAFKCMDTCVLEYFDQAYKDVGLVCLANWDTGFKNLSNNIREIKTVDDIKGMKIRYAGGAALAGTIEALGCGAVSIPWGETYIGLSQGTADAQFNPASTMYESKIHEVQKYYSNIPIQYGAEPITMSLITWNKLTAEQQQIMIETCQEAGIYQREVSQEMDGEALQTMIDEGVIYTEVSDEVLAEIKELTAPVLAEHCPPALLEAINAAR